MSDVMQVSLVPKKRVHFKKVETIFEKLDSSITREILPLKQV